MSAYDEAMRMVRELKARGIGCEEAKQRKLEYDREYNKRRPKTKTDRRAYMAAYYARTSEDQKEDRRRRYRETGK